MTTSILDGATLNSMLLLGANFVNPQDYLELTLADRSQIVCRGKRPTRDGKMDPPVCLTVSGTGSKRLQLNEADSRRLFEIERAFIDGSLRKNDERTEALKQLKADVKAIGDQPWNISQVFSFLSKFKPLGRCENESPLFPIENALRLARMSTPLTCSEPRFEARAADLVFAAGFLVANEMTNILKVGLTNDTGYFDIITTVDGVRFAIMDISCVEFPPEKTAKPRQ